MTYPLNFVYVQALWLSENQAKPMLAFQTDYDEQTGDQVFNISFSLDPTSVETAEPY